MDNYNDAESRVWAFAGFDAGPVCRVTNKVVLNTLISQRARPKPSFVMIDSKYCAVNVR